jgi:hypothetical protein
MKFNLYIMDGLWNRPSDTEEWMIFSFSVYRGSEVGQSLIDVCHHD